MTALHTQSYIPSGTVYGTLLNFQHEWALWADRMTQPPYQAAPQAPVLYVKTGNTFCTSGQAAPLPPGTVALEVGASLGLVMGDDGAPTACVLLNDEGSPITMSVAKSTDMRSPAGEVVTRNGVKYHVRAHEGLNMVSAERNGRWICLIGESSSERLMAIAEKLEF